MPCSLALCLRHALLPRLLRRVFAPVPSPGDELQAVPPALVPPAAQPDDESEGHSDGEAYDEARAVLIASCVAAGAGQATTLSGFL